MPNKEEEKERKIEYRKTIFSYISFSIAFVVFLITSAFFINFLKERNEEVRERNAFIQMNKLKALEEKAKKDMTPNPNKTKETKKETVVVLSPEEKLDIYIDNIIEGMALEEKVAGLFFVTPEALTGIETAVQAGDATRYALEQYPVGGIIYFSQNIQSAEQISKMIANSKKYCKYPLFIGVDEEGGPVSRIANVGLAEEVPSAAEIGATNNTNEAYATGVQIGTYLSELGFNVNFAPVADMANVENSIMAERSYGSTVKSVSLFAVSMMNGLEEMNVTACLKHFPGIGSSTDDTHNGSVIIEKAAIDLRLEELKVFKAGIKSGANMIMVSHASVPALDDSNTPASLSKEIVTNILRKELGFEGIIITDALNMSAISETYTSAQAAVMALEAGCDMLLMPADFEEAYDGVMEAVTNGSISEEQINESLKRIFRVKYADKFS